LCGLLGIAGYRAAAFLPLPDLAGTLAAFAFGPLLAVGIAGVGRQLAVRRPGPLPVIGAVPGIAGGATVLLMLAVQQAIFHTIRTAGEAARAAGNAELVTLVQDGLNAVHFGLDVAWDMLAGAGLLLLVTGLLKDPSFGRVLGGTGIALSLLLLGFNLRTFPVPPASAGSIDWGPFVAVWALVTFVQLLRVPRRAARPGPLSA
jgi:hypothetical protein